MSSESTVAPPAPATPSPAAPAAEKISFGKPPEEIGIRDLLEAGLHFGHQTKRWNPKMKRYIFDKRNGIHIIDLAKSLTLLKDALTRIREIVLSGRSILLVGTKKQAQTIIRNAATQSAQPYVATRWLGGCMTNRDTIRHSVKRLKELEAIEAKDNFATFHKKEAARARRELSKLRYNLGGIADMVQTPGALFVVDVNREAIAVKEARTLDIPVFAMVDTNCNPDPIDYVIPGNDDAIRAVELVVGAVAQVIEKAHREYAKIAAELARKKEEEAKQEAEARKAAQEARAAEKHKKDAAAAAKTKSESSAEKKPVPKTAAAKPAPAKAKAAAAKPAAKVKSAPQKADTPPDAPTEEKTAPAEAVSPAPAASAPTASATPDTTREAAAAPANHATADAASASTVKES
jgi:small subunit ribosomal protein S2